MKTVLLATDGKCSVQIKSIVTGLNKVCKHIRFESHDDPIDVGRTPISYPHTYIRLRKTLGHILQNHSCSVIATDKPYDNNFFYQYDSTCRMAIVSFYAWRDLTNLPKNNGFVGFIFGLLADEMNLSPRRHEANTGCIYDLLEDKREIDMRLRGGVLCRKCNAKLKANVSNFPNRRLNRFDCTASQGVADLRTMLDEVSLASKRDVDIVSRWKTKAGIKEQYHVFLCHNSKDKDSVRKLYRRLVKKNIQPWFDEEHLVPGQPWQDELEQMIPRIRAVAVLIGPNGRGPWQSRELAAFLSEFVNKGCSVIPVLLPDAPRIPKLPIFLKQFTWVDFRQKRHNPMERLIWGITGTRRI